MLAIFKREMKSYFLTPIGYISMGLFLLISGIFFAFGNLYPLNPNFSGFLSSITFIFLLVVPILTMRLFSEEYRNKTDQLIFTIPVTIPGIVLGKFLAAMTLFVLILMLTALYAVVIALHGPLDTRETVSAYIGFILMGSVFISIGLFISATTENQVSSALGTFGALLVLWFMDMIRTAVPAGQGAGMFFASVLAIALAVWIYSYTRNIYLAAVVFAFMIIILLIAVFTRQDVFIGFIGKVLGWISPVERYRSFAMGVIRINGVIYYLSLTGCFLFLTVRLIDRKRWA